MSTVVVTEARDMSEIVEERHRRPVPTTTIQAAGQAIGDVTSGLSRTPIMLGVIVLVCSGMGAAVYFLNLLINQNSKHMTEIITLQENMFKGLVEMHDKEFNSLMDMVGKAQAEFILQDRPTRGTTTPATPPRERGREGPR
jgi:hypothetical protein